MAGGRSNSGDAPDGAQAGIQSVEVALQLLTQMGELAAGASPPMLKTLAEAAGMAPAIASGIRRPPVTRPWFA